jgi:hypothetical protein
MQESQPLGHQLVEERIDAGRVAARPSEAGDKTKLDRVITDTEDDRDRRCCSFGRDRCLGAGASALPLRIARNRYFSSKAFTPSSPYTIKSNAVGMGLRLPIGTNLIRRATKSPTISRIPYVLHSPFTPSRLNCLVMSSHALIKFG